MSRALALVLFALAAAPLFAADPPFRLAVTKADVGKLPAGWTAAQTGQGKGSVWKVVADDTAPSKTGYVLAQTAEGPSALFNLCVADQGRFANTVSIAVALRAVRGANDQGGGVLWLYQDADNYYVTRYNPLEENFRVYKVVAGKRTQLGTVEGVKAAPDTWHTLRVKHVGKDITCLLDDKYVLNVSDDTFAKPGQVGLWTKADAQTRFDQFEASELKK
jgi:hypothetical protein